MPNGENGSYGDGHYLYRGGPSKVDQLKARVAAGSKVQAALLRRDPGSTVSAADRKAIADAIDARVELDELNRQGAEGDELHRRIFGRPDGAEDGAAPRFLATVTPAGRRAVAADLVSAMTRGRDGWSGAGVGSKAFLLPDGSSGVAVPLLPAAPVPAGRFNFPPTVPGAIPTIQIPGGQAQYLQQTARTNNADAVAAGALKPTSVYGLTKVTADLVVIAHITEPIDKYILEDSSQLTQFLADELTYGVQLALEDQVLNGDGVDPNMRGLLNTSGIQTSATGADVPEAVRTGITKLESAGYGASIHVVLTPADWERAETTRAPGSGAYEFGASPVNRSAFTLWGCPVVLSNSLAAGVAVLFSQPSVGLYVDKGMRVDWGLPGDTFTRNQIVGRGEMRAVVAAYQPAGICKVTLPTVVTP